MRVLETTVLGIGRGDIEVEAGLQVGLVKAGESLAGVHRDE